MIFSSKWINNSKVSEKFNAIGSGDEQKVWYLKNWTWNIAVVAKVSEEPLTSTV